MGKLLPRASSSSPCSRASMGISGEGAPRLWRERKSETSMALRDWVCESDGFPARVLCSQEGGNVEERAAVERAAVAAAATGKDWGGGPGAGGSPEGLESDEEQFFLLLLAFSLTMSRQAHWHWQASSCLMMITGTLRPICCTELPGNKHRACQYKSWQRLARGCGDSRQHCFCSSQDRGVLGKLNSEEASSSWRGWMSFHTRATANRPYPMGCVFSCPPPYHSMPDGKGESQDAAGAENSPGSG